MDLAVLALDDVLVAVVDLTVLALDDDVLVGLVDLVESKDFAEFEPTLGRFDFLLLPAGRESDDFFSAVGLSFLAVAEPAP